ncbi:hypothetical protein [Halomicrococcus sp. SG-WS-1]|uniref:hypothetical protein n=1 Tax=Halomicrococcus sp. SG-WS-1 TaxID=3439057 RepID=UPI003F7B1D43
MAAPSLTDGISRAIEVIAVPSAIVLVLVGGTRVAYDAQTAGVVYLGMTGLVLLGIYTSAKYWNTRYTIGFVGSGALIWFEVPGILPELIPPLFANLGRLLVLLFLVLVGMMIGDKW